MKQSRKADRTGLQKGHFCPCHILFSSLSSLHRAACAVPKILLAGLLIVSQPATSFCTSTHSKVPETTTLPASASAFQTEEYIAPGYPCGKDEQVFAGLNLNGQNGPDRPAASKASQASENTGASRQESSLKLQAKEMQELMDLDASKARSWQEKQNPDKDDSEAGQAGTLSLRDRMVRDAARTISFQKAVALRYAELNRACEERADLLGSIFSFSSLLIDGHILPPVLGFAGPVHTLHDADSASSVDETYIIRSQARLVSTAPSWRDYLTQHFDALEIRPECLPKTSKERTIWQDAVKSGWSQGTAQAEEVFQQNMDRLTADYRGMLRFTMLHKRGLVSLPVMARGHIPIRVGKTTLDINQTVFRLTRPSLFQNPDETPHKNSKGDAAKAKERRKKPKNPKAQQS